MYLLYSSLAFAHYLHEAQPLLRLLDRKYRYPHRIGIKFKRKNIKVDLRHLSERMSLALFKVHLIVNMDKVI